MNKSKGLEKKHDLFYDKIKDYHLGKLRIERQPELKHDENGYSKEYNRLVKAKKDIKDRVKICLDNALMFSEIVRMGEYSQSSRKYDSNPQIQKLDSDTDLTGYELTGDDGSVRDTIAEEAKQFASDIFDKETIERILSAIFFHGYHRRTNSSLPSRSPIINNEHRNYIINVAKIIVEKAITELEDNLDSPYAKFLSEDLKRAKAICDMIK